MAQFTEEELRRINVLMIGYLHGEALGGPARFAAKELADKAEALMAAQSRTTVPTTDGDPNGFSTVADLVAWIEQTQKKNHEDAITALLWWHAMSEAECMRDLNLKETAHVVMDGIPALTLADLDEWLEEQYSDPSTNAAEVKANIGEWLNDHFGAQQAESAPYWTCPTHGHCYQIEPCCTEAKEATHG